MSNPIQETTEASGAPASTSNVRGQPSGDTRVHVVVPDESPQEPPPKRRNSAGHLQHSEGEIRPANAKRRFSAGPSEVEGLGNEERANTPEPTLRLVNSNPLQHALLRTSSISGLDDALQLASRAARDELRDFAQATPPLRSDRWAALTLAMALILRWPIRAVLALPCCRRGRGKPTFLTSLLRLGGVEKVNTLLTVARFHTHGTATAPIDEDEFERQGEKLVNNATAGCQTTAVVATLFIATTHLGNIGRPVEWQASPATTAALGQEWADGLLWAAIGFNLAVELGALLLLMYCTLARMLLVYVLPSMGSRLTFICQSNLPGNLSTAIALLVTNTGCVIALGGLLHSPKWGLLAIVAAPVTMAAVVGLLAIDFYQATLILHRQVQSLLARTDDGDIESPRTAGAHASPARRLGRWGELDADSHGLTLRMLAHGSNKGRAPPILQRTIGNASSPHMQPMMRPPRVV